MYQSMKLRTTYSCMLFSYQTRAGTNMMLTQVVPPKLEEQILTKCTCSRHMRKCWETRVSFLYLTARSTTWYSTCSLEVSKITTPTRTQKARMILSGFWDHYKSIMTQWNWIEKQRCTMSTDFRRRCSRGLGIFFISDKRWLRRRTKTHNRTHLLIKTFFNNRLECSSMNLTTWRLMWTREVLISQDPNLMEQAPFSRPVRRVKRISVQQVAIAWAYSKVKTNSSSTGSSLKRRTTQIQVDSLSPLLLGRESLMLSQLMQQVA